MRTAKSFEECLTRFGMCLPALRCSVRKTRSDFFSGKKAARLREECNVCCSWQSFMRHCALRLRQIHNEDWDGVTQAWRADRTSHNLPWIASRPLKTPDLRQYSTVEVSRPLLHCTVQYVLPRHCARETMQPGVIGVTREDEARKGCSCYPHVYFRGERG